MNNIINDILAKFTVDFKSKVGLLAIVFAINGLILISIITFESSNKLFPIIGSIFILPLIIYAVIKFREQIRNIFNKQSNSTKYGIAIQNLSKAFTLIHEGSTNKEESLLAKLNRLKHFTTIISKTFSTTTESNCEVMIFIFSSTTKEDKIEVINLIRSDDKNMLKRKNENKYLLESNTSFRYILNNLLTDKSENAFYISNDIFSEKSYSSQDFLKQRKDDWKIPYQSILVVPIVPISSNSEISILGFLQINSDKKNAFDQKYDLAISKGVADGLYDYLKVLINDLIESTKSEEVENTINELEDRYFEIIPSNFKNSKGKTPHNNRYQS